MIKHEFTQIKEELLNMATHKKRLVAATIELTSACNFKCKHCYLSDSKKNFLETSFVKRILDELKNLGCVMLLFTGGEPFLHPNFIDIYIYAKKKGFIITVYTNGSCVNKENIEIFKEYKPYLIEISLYGIDSKSYSNFTQVDDSFIKVINTLNLLNSNNITFRLKTMLIKHTYPYIDEMKSIANKFNVQFRWDSYIIPTLNGDTDIISKHLLNDETMSYAILNDIDRKKLIISKVCLQKETITSNKEKKMYICDAGKTNVFISADAKLSMCVIAREPSFELKTTELKEAWDKLYEYSNTPMPKNHPCFNCEKINICRYCPAKFKLETGNIYPVSRYCKIADMLIKGI
jgi:radical SAM protein with 4Fe4S-binding SPASM domain